MMNKILELVTRLIATAALLTILLPQAVCLGETAHIKPHITTTVSGTSIFSFASTSESNVLQKMVGALKSLPARMGVDAEAVRLYAKWVIGAPVLVMTILILMLLRPPRKKNPPVQNDRLEQAPSAPPESAVPKPKPKPKPKAAKPAKPVKPTVKLSDQQEVLRFFLQLFRTQQGVPPEAPAQLFRIETRPVCPNETYEMRVEVQGEWASRRMSIGLLGQGGGSRSRCFYVIYDSHLVIKIPAVRLSKFSTYRRQIAAEAAIVARLAPRLCIVPRVSVILNAVHTFPEGAQLSEEVLEKKYIQLLEVKPEFQEHLKIGGNFAFFMDLAKHYFLSSTLEEIHSAKGRLIDEVFHHPELLWDQHGFVCRYGDDAGAVCQSLQNVYFQCEGRLRQLIDEAAITTDVPNYQFKQWFLCHMAGEKIRPEDHQLPAQLIEKADALLLETVKTHQTHVEAYRRRLQAYIRKTRFSQHRRQLENLATNILDLLAWIGQKGLAMRDLKPENLFVAGNPEEYPAFLNDPLKFSIGLIDVETAVVTEAEDPILIPQPQLAGTPLYATPNHLFSNAVLMEMYDDLPTILHLQDWYATIAIIFKLITGDNLFADTAHVFPEILNRLKVLDPGSPDLREDFARIHRLFWNSAVAEFQESLARQAEFLSRIEVSVPETLAGDIMAGLKRDIHETEKAIARAVTDQSFFTSGDKRRFLKEASADKIAQMRNKLIQEAESGAGQQQQILLYFEILGKLKERLEARQRAVAGLNAPSAAIWADQLLEIMFQRVFMAMYLPHWPDLTPKRYGVSTYLTKDITTYQATL